MFGRVSSQFVERTNTQSTGEFYVVFHMGSGACCWLCAFGIINALWLEHTENLDRRINDE